MHQTDNPSTHHYQNQNTSLILFIQQSQNSQVIFGKITLEVKKIMLPIKIVIELKGMYRIWDTNKQYNRDFNDDSKMSIEINNAVQTITEFQQYDTLRNQKQKIKINSSHKLQKQQFFLQGMQNITQSDQNGEFQPGKKYIYPFIFNVPNKLPPSLEDVWFARKRIQIKYFIIVRAIQKQQQRQKQQQPIIHASFQIPIRQDQPLSPPSPTPTFCRMFKYNCFTKFFCICLGSYHLQLSSTILRAGQIQIQGRVFRQGKKTQNIINAITIQLIGQLKDIQKVIIAQKKMLLKQNQYQMFEGQVILNFDPDLKTFQSSLITIRFWIECQIQFKSHVWKIKRQDLTTDILI